tara:strand:+ start:2176 stop:2385 length:210 start_codon:yes stop_codon:yes gene_type:complete
MEFMCNNEEVKELVIALEAAEQMANRFGEDVCVLRDYRVVLMRLNNEQPLEVVRPRVYRSINTDGNYYS